MLPIELEFIASEEFVEIKPTVKMDKIQFISVRFVLDPPCHCLIRAYRAYMGPSLVAVVRESRCGSR